MIYRQIGCADRILLNKVDLVPAEKVACTEGVLHRVNPAAPVFRTVRGEIDVKEVMGIGAYTSWGKGKEQDGCHSHSRHYEQRGISSLQVTCPVLSSTRMARFDEWIRRVLWEKRLPEGEDDVRVDILRCKGLLMTEWGEQIVLQGVRNVYEMTVAAREAEMEAGKVVLIGKGLNAAVGRSLLLAID
jgi:G3E family GTPase